jgi:Protein of unknown function (DUF2934)
MQKPTTKRPLPFGRSSNDQSREEQIRTRAYELYEARGREEGHDLEYWLEAEAETTQP